MEKYTFCFIGESIEIQDQAVKILLETFPEDEMWPDLDEKIAIKTVESSIADENICIGIKIGNELAGWVCLQPDYVKNIDEQTWELHPLAIGTKFKGKGYGKILMHEVERIAQEKSIIGIILSSGDEAKKTSLS